MSLKATIFLLVSGFLLGSDLALGAPGGERSNSIAVTVEDSAESIRLHISPPQPEEIRVYALGEPNRVVIDIAGTFVAPKGDLIPGNNPLISGVRFGSHPGKVRVVADIKTSDIPTPSVVEAPDGSAVILPVAAAVRAAFIEGLNAGGISSEQVASVPAVEKESPPAQEQRLTELTFDRHEGDGTPIVRLGLTQRPAFSFQKSDAKTYRITLPNCSIGGAQLAFPQYPPDDFTGFTIVEVRQSGTSTEVLVGVDRDFKIAPTTTENAILIRSVPRG